MTSFIVLYVIDYFLRGPYHSVLYRSLFHIPASLMPMQTNLKKHQPRKSDCGLIEGCKLQSTIIFESGPCTWAISVRVVSLASAEIPVRTSFIDVEISSARAG